MPMEMKKTSLQTPIAACKDVQSTGEFDSDASTRFCQQDEENDPSEVFEYYLACGVCGDNGMSYSSML